MKASVVIGSAYGDEGKGLFTDYLTHRALNNHSLKNNMVVRFNGGAQAGHTVTTPEGMRHVFGHVGSGAFNQASTFLSEHFVCNPLTLNKELQQIKSTGYILHPEIIINVLSFMTTPYDMLLNQMLEQKRGKNRHGSCGLGFGETIARCEIENFKTTIGDIMNTDSLRNKLINIRDNYFKPRVYELELITELENFTFILSDETIDRFIDAIEQMSHKIVLSHKTLPLDYQFASDENTSLVFEGAQGLLLDQNMGYFPYVTRSNTGLKNVIDLIDKTNQPVSGFIDQLDIVYASRCYTTRHGAGPLSRELSKKPYEGIEDKTNIPNDYQGSIRFSYLDLDILSSSIEKDNKSIMLSENIKITRYLGLSCLDQSENIHFFHKNELKILNNKEFPLYLKEKFGYEVLASYGPTRQTIRLI